MIHPGNLRNYAELRMLNKDGKSIVEGEVH
jgi:hypothetical protein